MLLDDAALVEGPGRGCRGVRPVSPLIQFEGQPGIGLAIRKEVLRLRSATATNMTRGMTAQLDATSRAELLAIRVRIGVEPTRARLEVHR
ncbi:MAG: hypothetical protein M3N95_03095 [Actinomycetota bacterium]|nr:hypothetical protein [Actinomycetota bacterium]